MITTNKIVFNTHVFKGEAISPLFPSLEYFEEKITNTIKEDTFPIPNYSLSLVPSYIKLQLTDPKFSHTIIKQNNWGYAIHLKSNSTIDDYLQEQYNSKKRSIIRRYVNRLEACFTINYKLYYGAITKEEYHFIMDSLKEMIVHRFKQRNEQNKELPNWDALLEETYPKIQNKQASLFVIYDDNKPIEISLNYHFGKILFSTISSYDIDYSKFGLGHVEIYKQIEWCCAHNYILFEMGVGGMDYKRRWSNTIYNFEHHIIYNTTNFASKMMGQLEVIKIKTKEYLKSKKINEIVPNLKHKYFANKEVETDIQISTIDKNTTKDHLNLIEITIASPEYDFLKKYVYDFLYTTIAHISTVKTYKLTKNTYLIVGNKHHQKILKES
ncbi:GNAT family N-acetyltransferase [Cellulophaga sp. F20128]|uniref:GNAT family N-acetyltransferase n=1 Tax=Cellulophaga sp. F20128 TaxID=2926413 RepID=UPI001FF0F749|nr:GNAT family N-acetyltransferase [Cellulophaga sp. F20128]MCK0156869.1 GNAT family N-acetyltransferase [Cellulophaga sp. F20128]